MSASPQPAAPPQGEVDVRATETVRRLAAGERVSVKDVAYVSMNYPEQLQSIMAQIKAQKETQQKAQDIYQKAAGGTPLDVKDVAFLAREYPETDITGLVEYSRAKAKRQKSIAYWTALGYPEYAGKYGVPDIPEDYQIKDVSEVEVPLAHMMGGGEEAAQIPKQLKFTLEPTQEALNKEAARQALLAKQWRELGGEAVPIMPRSISEELYKIDPTHILSGLVYPLEAAGYVLGTTAVGSVQAALGVKVYRPPFYAETHLGEVGWTAGWIAGQLGLALGTAAILTVVEQQVRQAVGAIGTRLSESETVRQLKYDLRAFSAEVKERILTPVEERLPMYRGSQLDLWLARRGMPEQWAIEKEWGWEPLSKDLLGSERVALEKEYGMPFFRAETLHVQMPTTEWQRYLYHEWFAPRMAIESQLAWDVGLMPAFPIKVGVDAEALKKPVTVEEQLAEAAREPLYRKGETMELKMVGDKLIRYLREEQIPTGETTIFSMRGAFEFEQSTKMDIPSRLFIPRMPSTEEFIGKAFLGRGYQYTPMETTLSRAIMGELSAMRGGLSAEILVPRILQEFPLHPPTLETMPRALVKAMPFMDLSDAIGMATTRITSERVSIGSILGLGFAAAFLQKHKPRTDLTVSPILKPITETLPSLKALQEPKAAQATVQKSLQALLQKTVLTMGTPTLLRTITPSLRIKVPPPPRLFAPPRRDREDVWSRLAKKKRLPKGKFEKRIAEYEYPVMGESEVSRYVLGKQKVRKERRKR